MKKNGRTKPLERCSRPNMIQPSLHFSPKKMETSFDKCTRNRIAFDCIEKGRITIHQRCVNVDSKIMCGWINQSMSSDDIKNDA